MQVFSTNRLPQFVFLLGAGLFFAGIFSGCKNPFQLRKPEPPKQSETRRVPATQPEVVLSNLKNAIANRNLENYMKCLADSLPGGKKFRFVADPTSQIQNPGLFDRWTLASEKRYANYLFSQIPKDSTAHLDFKVTKEYILQDTTFFQGDYTLSVHHKLDKKQYPRQAVGRAEFHLCQVQGEWFIFYWEDRGNGKEPSWSDVKAAFGK